MKLNELRQLIREEISKAVNENERLNPRQQEIAPGVINYYFDETKIEEANYNNGQLHGKYTKWVDKILDTQGEYVNGKKEGPWIEDASNDKTKCTGNYKNGHKDGKWELGSSRLFGKAEGSFNEGLKDGKWFIYDFQGKKIRTEEWDNGKLLNNTEE